MQWRWNRHGTYCHSAVENEEDRGWRFLTHYILWWWDILCLIAMRVSWETRSGIVTRRRHVMKMMFCTSNRSPIATETCRRPIRTFVKKCEHPSYRQTLSMHIVRLDSLHNWRLRMRWCFSSHRLPSVFFNIPHSKRTFTASLTCCLDLSKALQIAVWVHLGCSFT